MKKLENMKEIAIYQARNGQIEFRGDFSQDTIWGTQKQIAEVFNIDRSVATRHINKIMQDGEVDRKSNVQKMHIANSDKPVNFYSLDVILAVGYRANSAVWFLRKTGVLPATFTPEALTALTLLVAESNAQDKDKIIGLILLLLQKKHG